VKYKYVPIFVEAGIKRVAHAVGDLMVTFLLQGINGTLHAATRKLFCIGDPLIVRSPVLAELGWAEAAE